MNLFSHLSEEEDREFLSRQILTCIGNKRALLGPIADAIGVVRKALGGGKMRCFDLFSGSGIVSRLFKQFASLVVACDQERYASVVSRCYLSNRRVLAEKEFADCFEEWKNWVEKNLEPGFLTRLYAPANDADIQPGERAFYTRANAEILDTARRALDRIVPPRYADLLLGPLLSEASIHANTSGVFKGFYKNRQGTGAFGGEGRNALTRICGGVVLQHPVLSRFDCDSLVLEGDANALAATAPEVDLAYVDPPYNQHPYGSNYFMLNLLADYREPDAVSPVSGIPRNWNRSVYNSRREAAPAFFSLLETIRAKYLLVSYNSEGFIPHAELEACLARLGQVTSTAISYNTFRGSRNLRARAPRVIEYLFLVKRA